jgi:cell division protein FtsI/penicillin-binding protein 2
MASDTFKDHHRERRIVNFRLWLSVLVMMLMTGGLWTRLFYLQVVNLTNGMGKQTIVGIMAE